MTDTSQPDPDSKSESLAAGLYLVPTPIGNLEDITLRALKVLRAAEAICCEDTRQTRKLLTCHGIAAGGRLRSYHEHSTERVRQQIVAACQAGKAVALVSDAGAPLISDPGLALVQACGEAGVAVTALPGPSAPIAALQLSGLPPVPFCFAGFLPSKGGPRRRQIAALAAVPATLLFFEAPHRVVETLADLAAGLGPRPAALVREISKRFEEVRRGTLPDLAAEVAEAAPRGEIVLVVAPPDAEGEEVSDAGLEAALGEAMRERSLRDAVAEVAATTGQPRKRVYRLALALEHGKISRD